MIENAFGRLKGRWRCLLKQNDINTEDISTIITACCVLHNICEVHKNDFNDEWLEGCAETPQVLGASYHHTAATTNVATETVRAAIQDEIVP